MHNLVHLFQETVIYKYKYDWIKAYYTLDEEVKNPFKYITYIIAGFGLAGDLALFYTYWKKDLKCRFNILMLQVASFDFAYLIVEIVATSLDSDFNMYRRISGFLYHFTFGGSVYTTALMAIERFMILCLGKDTTKVPIGWTILFITGFVSLINVHNFIWIEDYIVMHMIVSINVTVNSILPTFPMIVFNILLYQKYKTLLASGVFNAGAHLGLQKAVSKAKVTILIGIIFVCSQVLTWIFLILHMVS